MEPEFVKSAGAQSGRVTTGGIVRSIAGGPLDSQYQREEKGFKLYLDGRRKEMAHKFFYDATTSQFAKGVCFFPRSMSSTVMPGAGTRFTGFGPLKTCRKRIIGSASRD